MDTQVLPVLEPGPGGTMTWGVYAQQKWLRGCTICENIQPAVVKITSIFGVFGGPYICHHALHPLKGAMYLLRAQ